MRLTTNKTSKGITYYIIRSVRRDGKRSSEVVERLGTEQEICEKYHCTDAAVWAKEHLDELNKAEAEKQTKVLVLLRTNVRIPLNEPNSYNIGYLFLQKIYYDLMLPNICRKIAKETSLAQFDGMLKDYMRTYNTTVHSGINCTPLERFRNTKDHPRIPASRQWLDNCFFNRVNRKVRKDATVSIDKISYDCPMQFISSRVEIRFLPDDMDSAFILYDGKRFPIRKTNKVENCHTKRSNGPALDYSKIGG